MKNFIALIMMTVLFEPSFAATNDEVLDTKANKNQLNKNDKDDKVDSLGTLRKNHSSSKSILEIGQNKSRKSKTEICGVKSQGKSGGSGMCGVPEDVSVEETEKNSENNPD